MHPKEARDKAVELRRDGLSFSTIGRLVGVDARTVRRWLNPDPITEEQRTMLASAGNLAKRKAALASRPPEEPGVIWVSDGNGGYLKGLVDAEDWERVRDIPFWVVGEGYAMARVNGRMTYLHRLIFNLNPGDCWPDGSRKEVDHDNKNRLDCRKSNMRVCTPKGNCATRGGMFAVPPTTTI